ncbi:MAG TPA: pyridoxamine 5'-phosphate oxidase family protein, partial [Feifaniaceae bacterium]|nr:pyridoxamine 5'-phosphate oxidase family protein [Feifaniaceae bacterium]
MKEVLDFLTTNKVFFVATADNNIPHVRPFGFVMDCGGKLAFCTCNQMDVCKQLAANPNVEISCIDAQCNTLRICGKAVFATSEETQRKALEVMPSLSTSYSVGDGKFEIFYLDEAKAVCTTMGGETQVLSI